MSQDTDDLPAKEEFLNEYAVLSGRHGHLGAWSRLLRKYLTWKQWGRFGLFLCAWVAMTVGIMQVPRQTGVLTVEYLSPGPAAVAAVLAMVVMAATWKLIEHAQG